jgi:SAM-dependent methyltransferase
MCFSLELFRMVQLCPLCDSSDQEYVGLGHDTRFGIPEEYQIMKCRSCRHVYTSNPPTPQEMAYLYERYYDLATTEGEGASRRISPLQQAKRYRNSLLYRLWRILDGHVDLFRFLKPGPTLDVGCYTGYDLPLLAELGCIPYGLEPNPSAAEAARRFGYEVFCGTIQESPWPDEFFENIILSQVLEHLYDPISDLKKLFALLRPGGRMLIACPHVDSVYRKLFRMRWAHWHLPFHLHHFSKSSLRFIARKVGLRVRKLYTTTPGYWIIMTWRIWRFDRLGYPNQAINKPIGVLERLLLVVPNRIIDFLGQGDCLVVILEK